MREKTQDGITLHVPDENTPILGLEGWRQSCWITGATPGTLVDWTIYAKTPNGWAQVFSFTKDWNRRCYLMGCLPTSAEGEFFRRFAVRVECLVRNENDSFSTQFDDVEVNLNFGAIPMKSEYFCKFPFTFVWSNMEFYFSDNYNYEYATQYCAVTTEAVITEHYPAKLSSVVENILSWTPIEAHRWRGAQGVIRDLPGSGSHVFEVEGLNFEQANADYIPARYSEREYRDENGGTQVIDGGGWGFFRYNIYGANPRAVALTTGPDLATDIIILYNGECLRVSGIYYDEVADEWVTDEDCSASLIGGSVRIGDTTYYAHRLSNLNPNGEYILATTDEPMVSEPEGRYMIFSRDYGVARVDFELAKKTFVYPKIVNSDSISRITHNSDDFAGAVAAGVLTDLRLCPDLTLKWLDQAGYVWSLPLFLDSAGGEVATSGETIHVGDGNYLQVYSGTSSATYYSPVLNSVELYSVRHITASPFYAIKGRGVKDMQYNLNIDHWFFVKIDEIKYEYTKKGGRVAVTIRCINDRDVDSIARTMFSQNLSQL